VFANYQTILKAVADGVLPALGGPVTPTIEGDTDVDALPGQLIGPFTIHTSVASVELTVSGGTLHNEDGSAFEGPASDGDEVWLKASEAGTVSLSGVAAGVQSGVRLFAADDLQDLAFLVVTPQEVQAGVEVTVHAPPTTSTSSTTSTTEQSTTTSSITPQSSMATTSSIVPQQGTGDLPRTGAPTLALVALALVLLAAGVGFGVVSRRRRDQTTEAT
jgi:LPXTG-motif cell wall-anchored protein